MKHYFQSLGQHKEWLVLGGFCVLGVALIGSGLSFFPRVSIKRDRTLVCRVSCGKRCEQWYGQLDIGLSSLSIRYGVL
jgi:hypothetical protein